MPSEWPRSAVAAEMYAIGVALLVLNRGGEGGVPHPAGSFRVVADCEAVVRMATPGSRALFSEKSKFAAAMEKHTGGDKNRPVVFLCLGPECWESYNACLHALEAGYKEVMWYRGGRQAWVAARLDGPTPETIAW